MKTRAAGVALMLGLSAVALTGCVNPVEELISTTVEDAIEGATGVDVDTGDGASVPDGFPASVPLPNQDPIVAASIDGGYSVSYSLASASEAEALIDEMKARFTTESETDIGGLKAWSFTDGEWTIAVTVIEDDATTQMVYVVVPAGS
ncbi:hypothetical protein GCM10009808_19120 [Microbacterium sediminicola]|uniref:Uncharacterized protein n=1 Tax=Microbacterium sediminicola TaxID=415210 RepID=A0ABP4UBE1_9MICO